MKGARKKKRERENKEKKTLSTTFRTARDGTEEVIHREQFYPQFAR